jgi:hypothetical protein
MEMEIHRVAKNKSDGSWGLQVQQPNGVADAVPLLKFYYICYPYSTIGTRNSSPEVRQHDIL